jgi:hypothetical protein
MCPDTEAFSRGISAQSAASAACLPDRKGYTFPSPAWLITRGSFGTERQSPRGLSPCPTAPGLPDGGLLPLNPTGVTGREAIGAAAVECFSNWPWPLRDHNRYRLRDLPPTEGRTTWRARTPCAGAGMPRLAWVQAGLPPTIVPDCQGAPGRAERCRYRSKRTSTVVGDFTASAALSADQGPSPDLPVQAIHRLRSASSGVTGS